MKKSLQKQLIKALDTSSYKESSFFEAFKNIIEYKLEGYENLKTLLEDIQQGGCISWMISEFIYNSDCKAFYIEHIDDLEDMKSTLEEEIGDTIKNRHSVPHYTFLCWLCFEEFSYEIYRNVYES